MSEQNEQELINVIDRVAATVHLAALRNGWWNDRMEIIRLCREHGSKDLHAAAQAIIQMALLGLVCSEAGEAIEFVRAGDTSDDKLPQYSGIDVELVDIVIRAFDMLQWRCAPVGEILMAKLKKNEERGYKHGGKLA